MLLAVLLSPVLSPLLLHSSSSRCRSRQARTLHAAEQYWRRVVPSIGYPQAAHVPDTRRLREARYLPSSLKRVRSSMWLL